MATRIQKFGRKVFKECQECKKFQPLDNYTLQAKGVEGRNSLCRRCRRDVMYEKKYGVGIDYFEGKIREQKNRCALCDFEFPLDERRYDPNIPMNLKPVLDHNHDSELPRGVLCMYCNTTLGMIEGRDEWIKRCVAYVKSYEGHKDY